MKFVWFTFRSVTAAMEGKRLLERGGIGASLLRTPEALRSRGCGYSLRVRGQNLPEGSELQHARSVSAEKVFREDSPGQWREVVP